MGRHGTGWAPWLGCLRRGHSSPLARPGPEDSSWWKVLPQQSVLCSLKLSQVLFFGVFLLYGQCSFPPITVISLQLCPALGLFSPRKDFGGTVPVCSCFGASLWHSPGLCPCPWHSSTARVSRGASAVCGEHQGRVPEQNDPLRNPQNEGSETPAAKICSVACQGSKA